MGMVRLWLDIEAHTKDSELYTQSTLASKLMVLMVVQMDSLCLKLNLVERKPLEAERTVTGKLSSFFWTSP